MGFLKNKSEVITYTIDKSIQNNLYISVQNGEVVVSAPWYFSRNQIQEVVEEKKKWIMTKIKAYEGKTNKNNNENSKTIPIWGEEFVVDICFQNRKKLNIIMRENHMKIALPNKYKKVSKDELMKVLVEKIYKVLAKQMMEQTMEKTRILLGFAPENYEVEYMENTLGKCTQDKTIVINPELMKYRPEIIEYVVLHEFCHLTYKTHTKGFYEMIKKFEPHYEEYGKKISGWQY
ncbi:MAG: M48 family metallopeptidase [Clostridia bacterium]|nr:M48 family metallopeptidase [Clostridia bacterium]